MVLGRGSFLFLGGVLGIRVRVGDGLHVAWMLEGRHDGCIPGAARVYPLLWGGVPFASLLRVHSKC